ncbi:Do family serine endopeptidase [Alcaligenaceae bacterium CGII-47]|nr:Do family serine endopeptidase [Alcaligenaceae bacterium CGII-47]
MKTKIAGVTAGLFLIAGLSSAMVYAETTTSAPTTSALVASLPDFTQVVAKTEGSVVNIRTTEAVPVRGSQMGPGADPSDLFRWFFGPDFNPPGMQRQPPSPRGGLPVPGNKERTVPRGIGSGFIISKDGYILTNNHVIEKSNGIFVTMMDGKEYKAKVIGTDPRSDVALIKIDVNNLTPLTIGDSDKLKKGQWVLAIGSPFGLDSTVTSGIISAINRDTGDYLPFIQTDVAVNPGNSGGPLINLEGEVVGINSQIVSRSGGFMGISLAIPIDEVMRIVEQLKATGKVTRGRIGVQITEVADQVAKALGMSTAHGALVSNVEEGGPADKAGIRAGDVITGFNGQKINHMSDLPRLVGATQPDTVADVTVWRKGKSIDIKAKIGEMLNPTASPVDQSSAEPDASPVDQLGLQVGPVPAPAGSKDKSSGGVEVLQVEGGAAQAGIEQGDIILRVNNTDIASPEQYAKAVASLGKSDEVILLVRRADQSQWVIVKPE